MVGLWRRMVGFGKRLWSWGEARGSSLAKLTRHEARLGEICFGVLAVSLCLHWFGPVTTPAFSALNFPLLQPARLWPKFVIPVSYAVPALLLCLFGYLGWRLRQHWMVLGSALLLLLLGATFFLEITCWEPTWLRTAMDGGTDFERFYSFEVSHNIPDAVRGAPAGDLNQTIDGLITRINGGISALCSGWYLFMATGILCLIAGLTRRPGRRELSIVLWSFLAVAALVVGVQLWRPIQGEIQIAMGVNAANQGDISQALNHFRQAIVTDKWNRLRPDVYEAVGSLFEMSGQKDQPEYHLYRAAQFEAVMNPYQALFELEQAGQGAGPELLAVIRRQINGVAQGYGKDLYGHGQIGEARKQLEIAIQSAPDLAAGYYLAGICSYELSDYGLGISYLRRALARTTQPSLIADLRTSLGDCYFKMGDVDTARSYYLTSRLADDRKNYRALKSLTEDYYR
jgi:energy-coupling factor transporter transmembrane protein EcfT